MNAKRGVAVRLAVAIVFCLVGMASASAQQTTPGQPPPPGFSLGLTLGPGWSSNPLDLDRPAKGDGYLGFEAVASYRWALWQGAALSLSTTGFSELYFRDSAGGTNRIVGAASLSQRWQGAIFSLGFSARSAANQHLSAHDSASQELTLGISRPFVLVENLTLILSSALGRRFYQDGAEDQVRARLGATLVRKHGLWTFRLGGGFSYALEDKTPILPRINDRTVSATIGASYEWKKDREVAVKLSYARTYSSYQPNRTRGFTLAPQVSATIRF